MGGQYEPISARYERQDRTKTRLVISGLLPEHFERLKRGQDIHDYEEETGTESPYRRTPKRRKTDSSSFVNGGAADEDEEEVPEADLVQEQISKELEQSEQQANDEADSLEVKPPTISRRGSWRGGWRGGSRGGSRGGWRGGWRGSRRGGRRGGKRSAAEARLEGLKRKEREQEQEPENISITVDAPTENVPKRDAKAADRDTAATDVPELDPEQAPEDTALHEDGQADKGQAEDDEEDEEPEDIITADDLPSPFLSRPPTPLQADCADDADYIVRTRFNPMTDPQLFIKALSKLPLSSRSTETSTPSRKTPLSRSKPGKMNTSSSTPAQRRISTRPKSPQQVDESPSTLEFGRT